MESKRTFVPKEITPCGKIVLKYAKFSTVDEFISFQLNSLIVVTNIEHIPTHVNMITTIVTYYEVAGVFDIQESGNDSNGNTSSVKEFPRN